MVHRSGNAPRRRTNRRLVGGRRVRQSSSHRVSGRFAHRPGSPSRRERMRGPPTECDRRAGVQNSLSSKLSSVCPGRDDEPPAGRNTTWNLIYVLAIER
jgi:hypothetical protein